MSKTISDSTFYGNREPGQWLVESRPQEAQSHFDRRGCVRKIRTSGYRSNANVHTPSWSNEINLPKRTSTYASLEQPSLANGTDRHAYFVYNAIPAKHRTVTDRPAFSNTIASSIPMVVELMVPLCCGKCEEKVKEELENTEGVYEVVCDQHNQRVAVSSTLDPERLLKRVKRVKKNSHFWSGRSRYFRDFQPSDHSNHEISRLVHRSNIPSAYNPQLSDVHHRRSSQFPSHQQYSVHHDFPFGAPSDASWQGLYTHATPYNLNPMDVSLHYDHLPSSYGLPAANEYESGDYALSYY